MTHADCQWEFCPPATQEQNRQIIINNSLILTTKSLLPNNPDEKIKIHNDKPFQKKKTEWSFIFLLAPQYKNR